MKFSLTVDPARDEPGPPRAALDPLRLDDAKRVRRARVERGAVREREERAAREHARVAEVFDGDPAVALVAEVEEVVHLRDDGRRGLGEVERVAVFGAAEVVCA